MSSWLARYPSASAEPIKDFDAAQEHFEQVHGSLIAAMKAGNVDRFKEILTDNPGEATAHKFAISKDAGTIISEQGPQVVSQFGPLLQAAQKGNQADVQEFLMTEKALTNLRKVASVYAAAPVSANVPIYNLETGRVIEYKHLTPSDKKQQLDAVYSVMQKASEKGLAAYNRLTK